MAEAICKEFANLQICKEKEPQLKIKLSCAQNGRAEDLIAYEWKILMENCGFCFADPSVKEFQLRKAIKTFYEEDVLESEVMVKKESSPFDVDNQNQLNLPGTADKLVTQWCREMGHGLQDQPRMEILNPLAYILKCTQVHNEIRLAGLSLGNFLNFGTYIEHFRLDMMNTNANRYPQQQQRNLNNNNSSNLTERIVKGEMVASFEHDCRRIQVKFTLGEYGVERDRLQWHLHRMNFDYNSIHSVIVDYSEDNNMSVAIYLKLKYVPKILTDVPKDQNDRMQKHFIKNYSRRTHDFLRIAEVSNWGKRLGKSSALKLIFPVNNCENKIAVHEELWAILSRLKYRAKVHVYFLSIRTVEGRENEIEVSHDLFKSYNCFYLIKALLSRGYVVLDQIDNKFVLFVSRAAHANEKAAEKALEILLSSIDEHRYVSLMNAFIKIYTEYAMRSIGINAEMLGEESETEVPRNCLRVRKLIVTPTRELLMPPEVIMGNRVLRQFGHEFALRLLFRDEDGQRIRADRLQEDMFRNLVGDVLLNGRKYGIRHYKFLAWSNSQLRDHGCYMFCKTDTNKDIADIRHWMGDFTASKNVPKYMSRMGQCFTQAQEAVRIPADCPLVKIECDITGGVINPLNKEPYVFSDGIGRISMALAKKVCEQLELDQRTPSAYQVRYAGCKGMLSVDVRLDKNPQGHQLILRDSMKKFESDQSYTLEIVKHSQPSPVYLNRPLIMILDQVSFKQGSKVFRQVTNSVHKLLENELFMMADMLLSEDSSLEALISRTSLKMDFRKLKWAGIYFTSEPFFRGLLLAIHYYTLKSQLFKAKIEIPLTEGRTMYGILDETGILQYGQVFIQYSVDKNKPGEELVIKTGKVMVTKNPCIVPGDVRLFKAVDKAALRHLYDVIVFPRNGPRPHTDEMAGSDLDGDEYAVYWNLDLMFERNEDPMDFPKPKADTIVGGVQDQDMVNFFHQYIRQDCIGAVSIAHLVCADREGLFSTKCMEIAQKCSMAVDFPKTGKPADKLTEDEMPYKYPDYLQREHKPMYRSRRLLGQLYRKIKIVSDTVELSRYDAGLTDAFDPDLEYPGWENYKNKAIEVRDQFVHHLQTLMDQYGIQDESQLISGHMVSIRNRVSDGEKEDFSFFNTEKLVELRIHKIFEKFRREFFDDFGGERPDLTETPSEDVQKKASAYYVVTYARCHNNTGVQMLSFPWLVWDILEYVKRHKVHSRLGGSYEFNHLVEPVPDRLAIAIKEFNQTPLAQRERMVIIKAALDKYPDLKIPLLAYGANLAEVLFVLLRWCEKENVYRNNALGVEHVAALFVFFASGQVGQWKSNGEDALQYTVPMDVLKDAQTSEKDRFPKSRALQRSGALALDFIKYLSSQRFRCQRTLDFTAFSTLRSKFCGREWMYLNSVAFKTYHHIAWTSNFKSLHILPATDEQPVELKWDRDELDPVPVHIRPDSQLCSDLNRGYVTKYCDLLKEWTGMDDIQMRAESWSFDWNQCLVVGAGSLEARNKLKELLLSEELEEALSDNRCPQSLKDD